MTDEKPYGLTRREYESLDDICWGGMTVAESAHHRGVKYQSVKNMLYVLYRIYGWRDIANACTMHGAGRTFRQEKKRARSGIE